MELDKFYAILGKITFSFSRIDFIISNLAVALGLVDSYPEFYIITSAEKKIKQLKKKANEFPKPNIKCQVLNWLENIDKLREKRNMVIHSIILNNMSDENDYRLYNFKKDQNGIQSIIVIYTTEDFEQLGNDLIEVLNSGFHLLNEIKKSTSSQER